MLKGRVMAWAAVASSIVLIGGTFPAPGPGTPGSGGGSFVTLESSSYGTGAVLSEDNLTSRLPRYYAIADPDFTGWTQNTNVTACNSTTRADLNSEIATACAGANPDNEVIVVPNCAFDWTTNQPSNSTAFNIPNTCDGLAIQFQANSEMVVAPSDPTWWTTPDQQAQITVASTGNYASVVASCSWVGGFNLNDRVLTIADSCNISSATWTPDSIVRVYSSDFTSDDSIPDYVARIACVDGDSLSDVTGTDCSLLGGTDHVDGGLGGSPQATTRIVLDWALPFDFDGSSYAFGPLTGQTIQLVERVSGGVSVTDNVPERVWFDGVKLNNDAALFTTASYAGTFQFNNCMNCGAINSDIAPVSTALTVQGGMSATGGNTVVARTLFAHNIVRGPSYEADCVSEVISIGSGDPVSVVIDQGGTVCDDTTFPSNGNKDWYISTGVGETALQGKFVRVTSGTTNGTTNTLLIDPADITQAECSGGSCASGAGGYMAQQDAFGSASYFENGGTDTQIIDNTFVDIRGMGVRQNGSVRAVVAYNWENSAVTSMHWRDDFSHGNGNGGANLIEGNDVLGLTYRASSTQTQGEGVHNTYLYNRLRDNGEGTAWHGNSSSPDVWTRGLFECNESADLDSQGTATTEYTHMIGNLIQTACGNGSFSGLDWWNAGASGEPGHWHLYASKNLWYGGDIDASFRSDNTTTLNRDSKLVSGSDNVYGIGHDLDEAVVRPSNSHWNSWVFPTSLLFNESSSRTNFINGKPPWACVENGALGTWIGSPVDNMTGGGDPSNEKLPAQLRYEAACTPL